MSGRGNATGSRVTLHVVSSLDGCIATLVLVTPELASDAVNKLALVRRATEN
jgi:hypothetical protein